MKSILKGSILCLLVLLIISIGDYISFSKIKPKATSNLLRVGYINLHESQISKAELESFSSFDCDIWLLAEWNGDNVDQLPTFETTYQKVYEKEDAKTYGFCVLAKGELALNAIEIDTLNSYACDYKKIMVYNNTFKITLLHAPPPVPTCAFETEAYINDFLSYHQQQPDTTNQLVIGDLNTTPFQTAYSTIIQRGFQDVFSDEGLFNGTYGVLPSFPKLLRIDYMFYKGGIEVNYCERFYLSSSDHCGLVADYTIKN